MIGPFPIIITALAHSVGKDVFAVLDPDNGGANTFSVPLSPTGELPATHFGTSTFVDEEAIETFKEAATEMRARINARALRLGRNPVGALSAFKAALRRGNKEQDFDEFIAEHGLKRIANAG